MSLEQLKDVSPEKLAEYFLVLADSLIEMVSRDKLTKMQILEIRAKNIENRDFKEKTN